MARRNPPLPGIDLAGTVLASDDRRCRSAPRCLAHGYDLGRPPWRLRRAGPGPAGWIVPLPDGVGARHAVTVGTAGFTAALSLRRLEANGVAAGRGPVLVTGASGGVGSMAVSLLAVHGYEVVASTGKTTSTLISGGWGRRGHRPGRGDG